MYAVVVSMCDFLGKLFSIGIQKWIYHKIIHNLGTWEMGLYGFVVLLLLILELIKTEGWWWFCLQPPHTKRQRTGMLTNGG